MKIKSGFKQKLALGLVCVLIVVYTVYHIVGVFGEKVTTHAAGITTESRVLNYVGYIFRDEKVLTASENGITEYLVTDGTKVSEGQELAKVYSKNRNLQSYAARLDEFISILEQSGGSSLTGANMEEQQKNNEAAYDAIIKLLSNSDSAGLDLQFKRLLVGLNLEDGLVKGDAAAAAKLLSRLKAERQELFSSSGSSVTCKTNKTGYFFSGTDGCEGKFTMEAAENISFEDFNELSSYAQFPKQNEDAYGKLCDSSEWMMIIPADKDDVEFFEEGESYSVLFSDNNRTTLPMTLKGIATEEDSDKVLLSFFCDRQPRGFKFQRCQGVSITLSTVSGINVPKNVVERGEGIIGVYILRGSVVHFRYIEVLYEGEDYYLVKPDSEHDGEKKYLRENDMIILTGQNLFDGRVLD